MNIIDDKRIVMTLDAGGTNFVFSAIRGLHKIIEPIALPSKANNLEDCLTIIINGFKQVKENLPGKPVAISFAFPGPADYPNGIIGNLGNLPSFKGGVALGPMLEDIFKLPVFINNDGDLFAYGESIAGLLPEVNLRLLRVGSPKHYKNLFGITLGTGFGGGFVSNKKLFTGDNSAASEIWLMRNNLDKDTFAEEGASIRAIQRIYDQYAKPSKGKKLSPFDIYEIANGKQEGDQKAALKSFKVLGIIVGDALANAITLNDSIVVIGGGLSNAWKFYAPAMFKVLNGKISSLDGKKVDRLEMKVFNLEDKHEYELFTRGKHQKVKVPFSDRMVDYDPLKRIGIGLSRLGTSHAVSIGAYAYALKNLQAKQN